MPLRPRYRRDRQPTAGLDSCHTPDGGSGPESTRNLGDLVNDLQQVSKLIGRGISTDVDRIANARRFPGAGVEPACRAHADSFHLDAERGGLSVNVIEHAAGRCEVEEMAAAEIGFNRDAFGCPPVREADGSAGCGPHPPSGYCDLEAIVHQPLLLTSREPPDRPGPPSRHPHMPRLARLARLAGLQGWPAGAVSKHDFEALLTGPPVR
jgi:hypothetical protein